MYKVIIVDDEEIMREGLINLVDWNSLGFEVIGHFEDGDEAVSFLEKNQVDVVLTDIKMTFISGIDLAKFIYERKLPVKTVFISGYKDFEYARQAVKYNIVQYLLKPISLKEIHQVFEEIRAELDKERDLLKLKNTRIKKYDELLAYAREQFFTDLVLGALQNPSEIQKRFSVLDLDLNLAEYPCCLWNLSIDRFDLYLSKNWDYGMEAFHKAIYNVLCTSKESFLFYIITRHDSKFRILIIASKVYSLDEFMQLVESHIRSAASNARKLLGIEVNSDYVQYFPSLLNLSQSFNIQSAEKTGFKSSVQDDLEDQLKLLMTHIQERNKESAYSLTEQILLQLNPLGLQESSRILTRQLTRIVKQLKMNNISVPEEINEDSIYKAMTELSSKDEIREYVFTLLNCCFQEPNNDVNQSYSITIQNIKEFIKDNYYKDITLDDIADYVFLSPVYISRLFKSKTGENFNDYLIRVRMENAIKFLDDPQYKVYEVGHKIGYQSTKYFYKLFKQFYGCTPTEYRRKVLRKGAADAKQTE
ncbi:MAG TPA: response regulator [Clostridiales bacterium]|nr:response regulator [Clostridiales bacterium]